LSARDTVVTLTPAWRATSLIVVTRICPLPKRFVLFNSILMEFQQISTAQNFFLFPYCKRLRSGI